MKPSRKPAQPAKPRKPGAGKGGNVPPVEHRFKNGPDPRRGNAPTTGAIVKNYINGFGRRHVRNKTLRSIVKDAGKPELMRLAAQTLLLARRATTLADFEPWIKGAKTLKQLASAGVDISVVKSATIGKDGQRKLELFDDAGENFDRIIEHTDGKPKQTTEVKFDGVLRTPVDRELEAAETEPRLRKILNPVSN